MNRTRRLGVSVLRRHGVISHSASGVGDASVGTTVLRGPVVDQAALHGLLQKLRDVGIPLISLRQVPSYETSEGNRP